MSKVGRVYYGCIRFSNSDALHYNKLPRGFIKTTVYSIPRGAMFYLIDALYLNVSRHCLNFPPFKTKVIGLSVVPFRLRLPLHGVHLLHMPYV
jgi:hypothetical protein